MRSLWLNCRVERRAIRESAYGAGAREVYLIEEPMAVAIGAKLTCCRANRLNGVGYWWWVLQKSASCHWVVWSTVRHCELLAIHSTKRLSTMFDATTVLLIGEASAERVKKAIATAWDKSEEREMEVKGRDIAEGLSRAVTLSSKEIYSAISDPLESIVQTIKQALEQTPPELSADIGDKGMVIAGGGALMRDLDRRLMEDTGLPVVIADDPLTCVARGCGRALEEMDSLADVFAHE